MKYQTNRYPPLTKSYKNYYPFKIGTTSFVYPDLYVPNVKMLGPYVDEIELLLFESAPVESLLSKSVINDLKHLSRDFQVSYNIHLPTDISISDPSPVRQNQAVEALTRIIERVAPLSPSSHALHVPFSNDVSRVHQVQKWQEMVYRNLKKIVLSGVPPNRIAIETLDYPPRIIAPVVADLDLSICADVGHLILQGAGIQTICSIVRGNVPIIHLHGVRNGRDHCSLDCLPVNLIDPIVAELRRYSGTVSLEVFNLKALTASLKALEPWFDPIPVMI